MHVSTLDFTKYGFPDHGGESLLSLSFARPHDYMKKKVSSLPHTTHKSKFQEHWGL